MSHLSHVWAKATDLQIATGSGSHLVTVDGDEYLDFTSGIAVTSTGHCHPKVVEAITAQAQRLIHGQVNVATHDLMHPLADRLAEITPAGIDRFFFCNSGAEAVESAVKLAKQVTGRPNTIVFQGSFHGRTHLAMAMTTSKTIYRAGYEPLPSGVFVAPFPDPLASNHAEEVRTALRDFDRILRMQTSPDDVAAVVIEPVLGVGGYIPAPRGFLEEIAARCRQFGIMFVVDEVQTGFGRTGEWFAIDRCDDAEPDIMAMGKGIASGFPFAAIGMRAEHDDRWRTGSHGGTFGGNPIGCAAALATIEIMSEPNFMKNVRSRGEQLRDRLADLEELAPSIRQVRVRGLMGAVSFERPERVPAVIDHCAQHGRLLLLPAGPLGNIIRWMPPLTVTADEIDTAVAAFADALRATE